MHSVRSIACSQGLNFCQIKYCNKTAHSLVTMEEENDNNIISLLVYFYFSVLTLSLYFGKNVTQGNYGDHGTHANHVTVVSKIGNHGMTSS